MNNGTCIMFVCFYIFRHYKRVGLTAKRNEMVSDFKKCNLILRRMKKNIDPDISRELVGALIDRINSYGTNMKLQQPLRYADNYDSEIVITMIKITEEIISYLKRPFHRRYSSKIFTRLLILHNLPRVLLNDSSGDLSTLQNLHMSKQEALACVSMYIGDERK